MRITAAFIAIAVLAAGSAAGQAVEYRSPAGVEYRAQRDTGAIARAESALAASPRNVDLIIQLGIAQSGVRQYREAIKTFTRGIAIAPQNAVLYRWRGHRYLSTRQFDRAMDELPEKQRLVLFLAAMEGHTLEEVSLLLAVPIGTVKSRLFFARKTLAEKLRCFVNPTVNR